MLKDKKCLNYFMSSFRLIRKLTLPCQNHNTFLGLWWTLEEVTKLVALTSLALEGVIKDIETIVFFNNL